MPVMPRAKGKAEKVAYAILGRPSNMRKNKKRQSKIKERLYFEGTRLVR